MGSFLVKIVFPILLLLALFLYFFAGEDNSPNQKEKYITLISYKENEENPSRSDVSNEILLDCQKEAERCQDVEKYLTEASCSSGKDNPRIFISGDHIGQVMVGKDCQSYKSLEEVLLTTKEG